MDNSDDTNNLNLLDDSLHTIPTTNNCRRKTAGRGRRYHRAADTAAESPPDLQPQSCVMLVDPLRDDQRRQQQRHAGLLDQLSDVSLDSGVNLSLDQDLSGTPAADDDETTSSSSTAADDELAPPPIIDVDDESDDCESECLSSDFSDHDEYSEFVSYRFDDYPDEVYCDTAAATVIADTAAVVIVDNNQTAAVSAGILSQPLLNRRRSSVINPAEVYVTDKVCHCDVIDRIIMRQSKSAKSR